jgi:D-amino-acid dehydrogenase
MRVLILGGGIVGVASAYYLLLDGHEVELVERRPAAGLETSWGNGAILHPSSVQPWAAPGMPRKILRWIGREEAPMVLRLQALPAMWRWGLAYLRNCAPARHRAHALANLALALESVRLLGEIRERTGIADDAAKRGVLKIYPSEAALDEAFAAHAWLAAAGLAVERLDGAACRALEPALAAAAQPVAGGLLFPQDEVGDCAAFTQALAGWCVRHGLRARFGVEVRTLELERGRVAAVESSAGRLAADAVVVALGSWTAPFLRRAGLDLPIYPVKGVSLTAPREPWPEAPRTAIIDDTRKFALTPLGERLRVAGSAEIAGYDATPDPRRVAMLSGCVTGTFPAFAACARDPRARAWAGLRPVTPTGVPLIGPTAIEGLYLNSGHGHAGWTMGCGSGRRIAEILGGARQGRPREASASLA